MERLTNQKAKQYLEETQLLNDVRFSMRDMILYIVKSGELERFWTAVEKENDRVKKEAKREF